MPRQETFGAAELDSWNLFLSNIQGASKMKGSYMAQTRITYRDNPEDYPEGAPVWNRIYGNYAYDYKNIYTNINISDVVEIREEALTLQDAFERLLNIQEPLRFNSKSSDYNEKSKYTIDKTILARYGSLLCPSVVYSGGKSLFEALLDLGREFDGIPVLTKDSSNNKVISFMVMNETSEGELDDGDELLSSNSDIQNNVSGVVSNVKTSLQTKII